MIRKMNDSDWEIGYRERIARDRFGNWQNTTMMEYRM